MGMHYCGAGLSALHFPYRLPPLLAVHLVPMVLRCSFVLLLWLGFHPNLPMSNSTWPGPVSENYSISATGSGRSPLQDTARHHLHNRQNRSHALNRAEALKEKQRLKHTQKTIQQLTYI